MLIKPVHPKDRQRILELTISFVSVDEVIQFHRGVRDTLPTHMMGQLQCAIRAYNIELSNTLLLDLMKIER